MKSEGRFGRARSERDAARKAHQEAARSREERVEENKRRVLARLDPMIRRLLDEMGKAEWGVGFWRRRYQIRFESHRKSWEGEPHWRWQVYRYLGRRKGAREQRGEIVRYEWHAYEHYYVDVYYDDDDGDASFARVRPDGDGCEVSESSIAAAPEKQMKEGPFEVTDL